MKYFGAISTLMILAFWITMNTLLVQRDLEHRRQGEYRRGLDALVGAGTIRESWMSIYQDHKKVGYSGYTLEKIYNEDGMEYQVHVDTLYRGRFPLPEMLARFLENSNQLELQGRLFLDEELEPTLMGLNVSLVLLRGTAIEKSVDFVLSGTRKEDKLSIEVYFGEEKEDEKPAFALAIPVEKMTLSNGLAPSLPLAEYEVGKKYELPVFEPLSFFGIDSESATVEVVDKIEKRIDGVRADVYEVETKFRGQVSKSWVTSNGDVLRQEIGPPLSLLLRKEPSKIAAVRGFEREVPEEPEKPAPVQDSENEASRQ